MKRMIIDTPNILFRVHSVSLNNYDVKDESTQVGLAMHMGFKTILSHFKKFKPDQVAFVFEGHQNWRKAYTKSQQCVSGKVYKANRVHTSDKEKLFELVEKFKNFLKNYTTAPVFNADEVEGDDLIAGYVQRFSSLNNPGTSDDIIILSGDKDFVQLLKHPNVTLINPDKGKPRTCEDPEYFMFEKCIRGDSGDNVMTAYPRVRSTKIQKAFTDEFERTNLMNYVWDLTNPETKEVIKSFRVGDLFEENQLLMNLERQPDNIKEIIQNEIERAIAEHGKFSYFQFMKFLGEHELEAIANESTNYNEIFSLNEARANKKSEKSLISF